MGLHLYRLISVVLLRCDNAGDSISIPLYFLFRFMSKLNFLHTPHQLSKLLYSSDNPVLFFNLPHLFLYQFSSPLFVCCVPTRLMSYLWWLCFSLSLLHWFLCSPLPVAFYPNFVLSHFCILAFQDDNCLETVTRSCLNSPYILIQS